MSGRLIDVNEAAAKMEELTREEIIGRHSLEFTTAEDGAAQLKLLQDVVEGKITSFELEKRYFRRDGTTFWVRNSSSVVPVAAGENRNISSPSSKTSTPANGPNGRSAKARIAIG